MRTNILKKIKYAGLLIAICVASCTKLDEYNPGGLSEENVLRDFNGWKAFQSNIYNGLWGSLIGMPYGVVSEAGTDLWTFPFNNTTKLTGIFIKNIVHGGCSQLHAGAWIEVCNIATCTSA